MLSNDFFIDSAELEGVSIKKKELLRSDRAKQAYRTGNISIRDIKDLDAKKIALLISNSTNSLYESGIKFDELNGSTLLDIKKNILKKWAIKCGEADVSYINDGLKEEVIDSLISNEAGDIYLHSYISPKELKDFPHDKITSLISSAAVSGYQTKKITPKDLYNFDIEKIKLLTSYEVGTLFENGVEFKDISGNTTLEIEKNILKAYATKVCDEPDSNYINYFSPEKIKLLVSQTAGYCFQEKYAKVSDFKDLDLDLITLLLSSDALATYRTAKITLSNLSPLDKEKISLLISPIALIIFKAGIPFDQIKGDTIFDIRRNMLISLVKITAPEQDTTYINNLDDPTISALTSDIVGRFYQRKFLTPSDLKGLNIEKITIICNSNTFYIFRTKNITFSNIKDLEPDSIKLLTSYQAHNLYDIGVTFDEIKGATLLDIKKNMLKAYAKKMCNEGNTDYIDTFSEKKLDSLLSLRCRKKYKAGKIKVSSFKNLSTEQIELITDSFSTRSAYKKGYFTIQDLTKVEELDTLKLLISGLSIDLYNRGIKFIDLKGKDHMETQRNVLKACARIMCKESNVDYINDFSPADISLLISSTALEKYKKGTLKVLDFKGLSTEKINILFSDEFFKLYRASLRSLPSLALLIEFFKQYNGSLEYKAVIESIKAQNPSVDVLTTSSQPYIKEDAQQEVPKTTKTKYTKTTLRSQEPQTLGISPQPKTLLTIVTDLEEAIAKNELNKFFNILIDNDKKQISITLSKDLMQNEAINKATSSHRNNLENQIEGMNILLNITPSHQTYKKGLTMAAGILITCAAVLSIIAAMVSAIVLPAAIIAGACGIAAVALGGSAIHHHKQQIKVTNFLESKAQNLNEIAVNLQSVLQSVSIERSRG